MSEKVRFAMNKIDKQNWFCAGMLVGCVATIIIGVFVCLIRG